MYYALPENKSNQAAIDADSPFESSSPSTISQNRSGATVGESRLPYSIHSRGLINFQYYKPWELLPKEEERVKSQIEQAEQDVERETEEFDNDNPSRGAGVLYEERSQAEERNQTDPSKTVGFNTNQVAKRGSEDPIITDSDAPVEPMEIEQTGATAESSKDHHDDGGEVVEGDEDTVIY